MRLAELLSKKLLIVSGKGGVGKTTLSLALALIAAEKGRKVLLAEINSEEQVAHLLKRPPIGYGETELLPNLWGLNINPKDSFKEYVLLQIKIQSLFRAIFENRFVKNFIEGTPGLADLMCIGKVYAMTNCYDLAIVDAPSTGHTIGLLQIADTVSRATRVGPLKTEAEKIGMLLHDKSKTSVVGVCLPEEMPVSEMAEMESWLRTGLKLSLGSVFMNQVESPLFSEQEWRKIESWAPDALARQRGRAVQSGHYIKRLRTSLPGPPLIRVPFIYSGQFGLAEIERIAETIRREMQ